MSDGALTRLQTPFEFLIRAVHARLAHARTHEAPTGGCPECGRTAVAEADARSAYRAALTEVFG